MLSNDLMLDHHLHKFVFAQLSGVEGVIGLPPLIGTLNALSDLLVRVFKVNRLPLLFKLFLHILLDQSLKTLSHFILMLNDQMWSFSIVDGARLFVLEKVKVLFALRVPKHASLGRFGTHGIFA